MSAEDRARDRCTAPVARHPHALTLDTIVHLAAAPMRHRLMRHGPLEKPAPPEEAAVGRAVYVSDAQEVWSRGPARLARLTSMSGVSSCLRIGRFDELVVRSEYNSIVTGEVQCGHRTWEEQSEPSVERGCGREWIRRLARRCSARVAETLRSFLRRRSTRRRLLHVRGAIGVPRLPCKRHLVWSELLLLLAEQLLTECPGWGAKSLVARWRVVTSASSSAVTRMP